MASEPISVKGIILFSEEFKDKDRMITVLTSNMGIIKVCVKGAGKTNSKTSYLSVPFMLVDFTLTDSHGFWYLKEGEIIESNSGIMSSLEAMEIASHIADLLVKSVYQSDVAYDCYQLTVYAYYVLSKNPNKYKEVYSAFNIRYLYISGLASIYTSCSNCKTSILEKSFWFVGLQDSSCYCNDCCRASKINTNTYKVSRNVLNAVNYYIENQVKSIFGLELSGELSDELYNFTTSYLSTQLDERIDDPISKLNFPRFIN